MTRRLFDVPATDSTPLWTQFQAAGYSEPVWGVIYRNQKTLPGMPLGGIGTGFIRLGVDGTLDYYSTIFNAHMERELLAALNLNYPSEGGAEYRRHHIPTMKRPFLGLSIGEKTWLLSSTFGQDSSMCRDIVYWGHYPIADLEFINDAPVQASLRAWTPFIPGCSVESNTPGCVFEVRLKNTSSQLQKGVLALSFIGPRDFETGGGAMIFRGQPIEGKNQGIVVNTRYARDRLSYALAAIDADSVRTGGELSFQDWPHIHAKLPDYDELKSGASVAVDFDLGPGEETIVRFVLAWFNPTWQAENCSREQRRDIRHVKSVNRFWLKTRMVNKYADRFSSAADVVNYLTENHASLLQRIVTWQQEVYTEDRLPGWLRDSLVNIFHILPQESFWIRHADRDHWWGEDGHFCVNESLLSCPQMTCNLNDVHAGEWPVQMFFPGLAINKLSALRHYQKENGQIPATMGPGTEPEAPRYNQQITIEDQIYARQIHSIWRITGDDSFLKDYYPSMLKAMRFAFTIDEDGDALPEVHGNDQPYDDWPEMAGAAIHVSGMWMGSLSIAQDMAKYMGDEVFTDECQDWIDRGLESIEAKLWNPELDAYLLFNDTAAGKKSDTILADQLFGQWLVTVHGLTAQVFHPDRIRTVLNTIWENNVKVAQYGIRAAIRPDHGTDYGGLYSRNQIPSYTSLTPAMLAIWHWDREKGIELMRSTWAKMCLEKEMTWDMPCVMTPDGDCAFGMEYYHNTMLWTLPLALLNESMATTAKPGGFAYRVCQAGKEQRD